MSVENHLSTFHSLPVVDYGELMEKAEQGEPLPEPDSVAWRLALDIDDVYDPKPGGRDDYDPIWRDFLARVDLSRVRALVLGVWDDTADSGLDELRDLLIEQAESFPALRAVFLGDLVREESDIAYIQQCDPAPLLDAFPLLEEFGARGGDQACGPLRHTALRTLRFESGGLPEVVVRAVGSAELPSLERLDLWLGVEEYGGTTDVSLLAPLLDAGRFPRLRHLGLADSEIQDAVAAAVASAPVVAQLESLDLSMGILTDTGAEALLTGQPLTHLARLDLHHHFLSAEMAARLRAALEPAGVAVDLSDAQVPTRYGDEDPWFFVAVSE
ncbi:STM4015 family protein [Streptacidiphilus anmyonensis]|uniref:STM4015 family protein n=1 Tax=Streptacidiphilus anmyonensis TaxID=405782 RepID=UPI0005A8A539|nr:STM4015 family protein [Streptacidiphilus anmyonensis]